MNETDWHLYYIDRDDDDIHQYNYSFPQLSQSFLKKLSDIQDCADNNNVINIPFPLSSYPAYYSHPKGVITVSPNKDIIYYKSKDQRVWYYFNDQDKNKPENWYKAPVNLDKNIVGTMAFETYAFGSLLYVGDNWKLYRADYIDADNPQSCSTWWEHAGVYKTDGNETNTDNVQNKTKDKNSLKEISAFVFPNPSQNMFTFTIIGLTDDALIDIKVQSSDGRIIYSNFTSNSKIEWDASKANSGIYYYLIKTNTGETVSGKMIKL